MTENLARPRVYKARARIAGVVLSTSVLSLPSWIRFSEDSFGLIAEARTINLGSDLPALDLICYRDSRGRFRLPGLHPHLALKFRPTPTQKPARLRRQWLALSQRLAHEMQRRGSRGALYFPADIVDIRAWLWSGFEPLLKYTLVLDQAPLESALTGSLRNKLSKAERAGLNCERARTWRDVFACVEGTEARQKRRGILRAEGFERLVRVDPEHCRFYCCYGPGGEPASARVVLFRKGATAIDLLAGSHPEWLASGATQLLIRHILRELFEEGASGYDFCGVNKPHLQSYKSEWGGQLRPYFGVRAVSPRSFLRPIQALWRHWKTLTAPPERG